jgi:hypothetical protein
LTAPVRIEAHAWGDLRFATLARLIGAAEADHALIKVAKIWSWQTEHYTPEAPTYWVEPDLVESALGPGGADALVRSRLAEEGPGGLRPRGTRGRIEWLHQKRIASAKGGEATRRKHAHKEWPSGLAGSGPEPGPKPGPLTLALTPEDQSLSPARAIPPSTGSPESQDKGDAALRRRQEIRAAIWSELGRARAEVAAEFGIAAQPLMAFDPGENALAMRLLRARDAAELELVASQARHAIAILAAEARAASPPTVEWMTGAVFESDRSWRRAVGMTLADAQRGSRAGPRSSAERAPRLEPVRKIKTL